tara:strand:- start:241 stop:357 length:117 start_codon:yes stop_codon:yes gene_type:complete
MKKKSRNKSAEKILFSWRKAMPFYYAAAWIILLIIIVK